MSSTRRQSIGFLGFPGCGKTTLFSHLASAYSASIEDKGNLRSFNVSSKIPELSIWDLNYHLLNSNPDLPEIIRDTFIIFVVYDITRLASLIDIDFYYRIIVRLAAVDCKIIFVGNKADQELERCIPKELGSNIKNNYALDEQFEISANKPEDRQILLGFFKKYVGLALASKIEEVKESNEKATNQNDSDANWLPHSTNLR